jgi:hypothetical protein
MKETDKIKGIVNENCVQYFNQGFENQGHLVHSEAHKISFHLGAW